MKIYLWEGVDNGYQHFQGRLSTTRMFISKRDICINEKWIRIQGTDHLIFDGGGWVGAAGFLKVLDIFSGLVGSARYLSQTRYFSSLLGMLDIFSNLRPSRDVAIGGVGVGGGNTSQ